MSYDEMNTYKWLDAQELMPKGVSLTKETSADKVANAFSKKIASKYLELLDMV